MNRTQLETETDADNSQGATEPTLAAAMAVLLQAEEFIAQLTPQQYRRCEPLIYNASIGGHFRHCLDHFSTWINGRLAEQINYDHRERNPRIELDPAMALDLSKQLRAILSRTSVQALQHPIHSECRVAYGLCPENPPSHASSVGRELCYCICHAIHHYALMGVLAKLQGIPVPPEFGIAPSTATYLASLRRESSLDRSFADA